MFICSSKPPGALQTGSGSWDVLQVAREAEALGLAPDRCPAPACSSGLCRGEKLTGLHPGWLVVSPCPDVPREAKWLWKGPLCWHGHFQQTNENALLLKSSRTLWGPRGCKSTLFLFLFRLCHAACGTLVPQPGIEPMSLASPPLSGGFFTTALPGKHHHCNGKNKILRNIST